ncbi:MAG TPA: FIST N-terminal domain-containing protein [Saprospiraceae bacterium]|nr:FIST N-terminal domain-containing protein [Saprospiraceae bacterium]HMQ82844.1 FIST N-terminal domain-containing protein [Saprospiraceae bacterium]
MLTFYSASNGEVNAQKAMNLCLQTALKDLQVNFPFEEPILIIIHSTIGHHFPSLLEEAKRLCPNARLAGCTCNGVTGVEGANESMRALGIMVVRAEHADEYQLAFYEDIRPENSYAATRAMAQKLYDQNPNINMVGVLASGIDIAADRAIEGIESVFGSSIPIFGGTSSDNMKAISSYQFIDAQLFERGAVMFGFADPTLKLEMGVHHGSVPIGNPLEVTRSVGNRIFEIDGTPAWAYLMRKLHLPENSHPGPCIPVAGLAIELPASYQEAYNNAHILRAIVKVEEDQSFYIPVDCEEGTKVWLVQRDEDLIFEGLDHMLDQLNTSIAEREIVGVFHTDCAARGRAMFNKIEKEEILDKMQMALRSNGKKVPWLGMYGLGEFAQINGRNFFHNYTTSIYAITRK